MWKRKELTKKQKIKFLKEMERAYNDKKSYSLGYYGGIYALSKYGEHIGL